MHFFGGYLGPRIPETFLENIRRFPFSIAIIIQYTTFSGTPKKHMVINIQSYPHYGCSINSQFPRRMRQTISMYGGYLMVFQNIPSGYVKIAIENGHRNSEFSH